MHKKEFSSATVLQKEQEQIRERWLADQTQQQLEEIIMDIINTKNKVTELRTSTRNAAFKTEPPSERRRMLLRLFEAQLDLREFEQQKKFTESKLAALTATNSAKKESSHKKFLTRLKTFADLIESRRKKISDYEEMLLLKHPDPSPPPPLVITFLTFWQFEILLSLYKLVPGTSIDNMEKQALLLGAFNRPEVTWPVVRCGSEWHLDCGLMQSLVEDGQEVRPAANRLLTHIRSRLKPYHLLLAASGSGKTSAIADLAREHFVIYIKCMSLQDLANPQSSRWGSDNGFASIWRTINEMEPEARNWNARHLFTIELTCRLAQLYKLFQLKKDLKPFEFFIHQRMVGDEWIGQLRERLKSLSDDTCQDLVHEMCNKLTTLFQANGSGCELVIAVDNIEVGDNEFFVYHDGFNDCLEEKAILVRLVAAISTFETAGKFPVIYAGTCLEVSRERKRGVGKETFLNTVKGIPDIFPHVTADACRRFFCKLDLGGVLDLDQLSDDSEFDCNWSLEGHSLEEIINYAIIGGRFGALTRIIENISSDSASHDPDSRRSVLHKAIVNCVRSLKDDVFKSLDVYFVTQDDKSGRHLCKILCQLWAGLQLNGGRFAISKQRLSFLPDFDLMKLGLANYADIDVSCGHYEVNERIMANAIVEFAKTCSEKMKDTQYHEAYESFERLVKNHPNIPTTGNMLNIS